MVFPADTISKDEERILNFSERAPRPNSFPDSCPSMQASLLHKEFEELNEDMLEILSDALEDTKDAEGAFSLLNSKDKDDASEDAGPEKKECDASLLAPPAYAVSIQNFSASSTPAVDKISPTVSISSQISELFDKMAGAMIVMDRSGITETRILLNSAEFSSSRFFGSEILIQEFSTAPKSYNVQFLTTSSSIELFNAHAGELVAALKEGNFGFTINRLEAFLHSDEKHLVSRKENASEDKQEKGEDSK